jgi:hypothetical protein
MTGFTTSVFLSRNRVSPKEAFEGLELCERKLSCTVLRGLDGSNPVRLLGFVTAISAAWANLDHAAKAIRLRCAEGLRDASSKKMPSVA